MIGVEALGDNTTLGIDIGSDEDIRVLSETLVRG
jgi:hypothetical protein